MASLLFWGTKYMRKGEFFCPFELLLRRSYIMKECKVSVWNKVKEVDVKQDNLKKVRVKKTPKTSLHQDSEVIQKGRNKKKKGKLKPRTETDSRNPTEGTKREKKQMPLRKLWQKEKKNEGAIWWEPQEATQAEGVRLTLSLSWQASLSIRRKN